jgi:CubicO group peptidase (beta-lactamase class C family)
VRPFRVITAGLALLTLVTPATRAVAQQSAREPFPGLDAYVRTALTTWKVPGVSIAIVRNDSLIYAKGYGVREIGKPTPVDERTMFAIGSSSKAFTSAAVAMLVDSGKVRLDAPATTYLPSFQLNDAYASREITVRDLLSHRSGLARGELIWYGSDNDRDEILRRVRFLPPSWTFRSQFGYQNIMYLAAGQVVAKTTNASWDDFIRQRIFQPLGMTASNTSVTALKGLDNVATPHSEVNDTVRAIPYRNIDNIAPAGSINSNAVDMAQWVRLHLGDGKYAGKQLISKRLVDEMRTAQMSIPRGGMGNQNPSAHLTAYGLGWFLSDYEGKYMVQHGGNIDGMTALVAMLPEEKFGVVILSNMNGSTLPTALMLRIVDAQLKRPAKDWSAQMRSRADSMRTVALAAQQRQPDPRVPNTKPSLPLSAYAGTYADSAYGTLKVTESNGTLNVAYTSSWRGPLEHYHFDTFRMKLDTPVLPPVPVNFRIDAAGKVDEVRLDLAGQVTFKRVPDRPARAAAAGSNPQ